MLQVPSGLLQLTLACSAQAGHLQLPSLQMPAEGTHRGSCSCRTAIARGGFHSCVGRCGILAVSSTLGWGLPQYMLSL